MFEDIRDMLEYLCYYLCCCNNNINNHNNEEEREEEEERREERRGRLFYNHEYNQCPDDSYHPINNNSHNNNSNSSPNSNNRTSTPAQTIIIPRDIEIKRISYNHPECVICLGEFNESDPMIPTLCSCGENRALFHLPCLLHYKNRYNYCPVCKGDLYFQEMS